MRRTYRFAVLFFMACATWTADAHACRCRPQPLAHYYRAADHVYFGTLNAVSTADAEVVLEFTIDHPSYKGAAVPRRWFTAPHSAACGLSTLVGRRYLVFAIDDPDGQGAARIDTCNGSRVLEPGGQVPDFSDVPGRHVARQLEAMAAVPTDGSVGGVPREDSIVGLLAGEPAARAHDLYASPDDAAPAANGVLAQSFERREVAYEAPALVVTASAAGGWYRVRRDGRPAWIHVPGADYHDIAEVVVGRLNYLTGGWDGVLWPAPGAGLPFRTRYAFERPREVPASVTGVERIADSTWWRVEVYASNPCEGGDADVLAAGYVPAWNGKGEATAWFWSRGC